ncbi:MAG: hypothetical protein HY423_12185 [Candidatus Lambdaproteobacteria bacterium]|nr:hypothetical protein [Candidatus Lambdaproteobacteria bacterium]
MRPAIEKGNTLKAMKALGVSLLGMALLFGATGARAQEPGDEGGAAPQILTADLAFRQKVETDRLRVNFVIVDTDKVTEVRINGIPQQFTPADTVQITAELQFNPGRNTVTVEAVDEQGNKRVRKFLVGLGDVDISAPTPITWGLALDVRYELDDNPTNDLSSPIDIPEIGKLQGAVDDKEQPDYRTTLGATLTITRGALSGFLGARNATYAKAANEALGTQIAFAGLTLSAAMSETSLFRFGYTFMDINVGTTDYSVNHVVSPAFVFSSKDDKGSYRKTLGLDVTAKDFALKDQKDTTDVTLKWRAFAIDPENQDSYRFQLQLGSSGEGQLNNEGKDASLYNFASMDFDWKNRWDRGFLFDIGFGFQYRNYPNETNILFDALGKTRVDNLIRFSTAFGWGFGPDWAVRLNYDYLFDLSNKSPYVRTIAGVALTGAF